MSSWLKEFQAHNKAMRQDEVDIAVFGNAVDNILRAASAMLEAKVKKDKVKELLMKHWDICPSDADFFIKKAEEKQE